MELRVGQTVVLKKKHPCGCSNFTVTRVGMDVKLVCTKCGHEVMMPVNKAKKAIRQVLPEETGGDSSNV